MRLRKAIKKIVALGTGTTMIGATLLAASAANLADYPSPFVKDGVFNGKIVVGAQAAAQDVIGSIEIATGLQTKSVTETEISIDGSSSTTTLVGDSFKIEKSTDKLNFNEALDQVDSVIDTNLDALADGTIVNNYGTYRYEQVISNFSAASVVFDVDDDQSDDPALYVKFPANSYVYTYRISFPTALASDVDSDKDFDDLDNKKLTLLGTEYTITNTDNTTGTIELMGGAIQDTMQEYTKKTYNLEGKDYEVEVVAISATNGGEVIFKVNGQVSEKKQEGETIKLIDGTEIGVKTILENEGTETGGGDLVTFYLGASKVSLIDSDWSSGNTGGELEYAGEEMDDVIVDIVGDRSANKITISKIEISWLAGEDFYVPVGGQLSELLEPEEKGFLFLENMDFNFAGFQDNHNEDLVLKAAGDDEYDLTISTTQGSVSKTVLYTDANGNTQLGEANYPIDTDLTMMAAKARFFLTKNKDSYFLEVKKVEDDKVTFTNLITGENSESSVVSNAGTLLLSGSEFAFITNAADTQVNLTDKGDKAGRAEFFTEDEFLVEIERINTTATNYFEGNITITEFEKDDTDTKSAITTLVLPQEGVNDMGAAVTVKVDGSATLFESWDSKDNYKTGYTNYGTYIEWDTDDQDQVTFSIGKEAIAEVFITSGTTQVSTTGGSTAGTVTTTTVNEIQVGAAVLDTEVTDVTRDNYIVVGGPCANSAAARLVGVAQSIPECLSGLSLSEGEGVVKLFENGDKVSMLVAGATALDSQRASRVVAQHDKYPEFTGMEVSVTGTSLSDITVSAPSQSE